MVIDAPWEPTTAAVVESTAEDTRHALVWSFPETVMAISSAPVGGGTAAIDWALNVGVTEGYARTDLGAHVREVSSHLGLDGTGAAMLTAADVRRVVRGTDEGVVVDATVGVTKPTWAADADGTHARRDGDRWVPGTINILVQVPVALSPAAAVNAVMTATEAKSQALIEAGVPGTGTASDAVLICWPPTLPVQEFGGPRSPWGARIARATHAAMVEGLRVHP
ncbi:adenosylcobinamide amidohydrolase [Actinospongicola halichondriae]|uniref:adenosylcobinamide amidohydrolase n=1 Tax=Actinospongicola halichondriae TaxID=3236844 RepID=UPI003D4400BC